MAKKLIYILILLILRQITFAQTTLNIVELNKKLGRGINMGNMFEAPSEGEWGNPYKDDYFQKIATLGLNHVRIPIRWDVPARTLQAAPYSIDATFLARIKSVIDNAIANKLMVIINMHHHEGIFASPVTDKEKFLAQWTQIAEYFKGYDQNLLFEVMNEPHDNLSPALWNVFFNDALLVIRKTNPTRGVIMGMANYGGLGGLPDLKVPDDKNIIVSIHYYNPFNFTHQGADWVIGSNAWLGTKWEDLQAERNQITSEFEKVLNPINIKNIPINIGEFGAYSTADLESRAKWTTYLARWFELQGWSWAYWEWSAGFGIYDPKTSQINTKLADALLKNPMPEAKKLNTKAIYLSDFSSGNDGWTIALQPGSDANLSRLNSNLNIDVKTSVANAWHVQLTKPKVALTNKKRYQVTVKASSTNPSSVTCYVGKNADPYNSYSGYPTFNFGSTEKEYSFTFIMNDPTDPAARISLDMGSTISKINILSIKLEELVEENFVETPIVSPLATENEILASLLLSPNPTNDFLNISHDKNILQLDLVNLNGKIFFSKINNSSKNTTFNLSNLPAGMYVINLFSEKYWFSKKFIKQ
jgi:endoglucanase